MRACSKACLGEVLGGADEDAGASGASLDGRSGGLL